MQVLCRRLPDRFIGRHRLRQEIAALEQNENSASADQRRACQESANRLHRRIKNWAHIQTAYIPRLVALREKDYNAALIANNGIEPEQKVENVNLYLPSSLPHALCPPRFNEYEWKLREAEAYTALYNIRYQFRIKAHWQALKRRFHRGVSDNTRSNATLNDIEKKIKYSTEKYRYARDALLELSLRPGMDKICSPRWMDNLRVLANEDIRGLTEAGLREGGIEESNGRLTISWIWKAGSSKVLKTDRQMKVSD